MSMKRSGRTQRKKKGGRIHADPCMSIKKKKKKKKNKSGRMKHVHEKKRWTEPKKQKKTKKGRMHVHEQKWTDKKNKIDDKITLSHVGKSTIQSRRTKYHKNGTLIEDYNASRRLKVRASRVPGAVYQWPTMQKNVQSYI